jgi:uncharacterized protein (TIGR02246 family)
MFDSSVEAPTHHAVEARAVRAVLARTHEAWARGDGHGYAACFTEDTSCVTFLGLCRDGRAANAALHEALFQSVLEGTRTTADIDALEWLSCDVALVRTATCGRARGYQTYVMVKRDGVWLIRSFRTTRARPAMIWFTRWLRRRGTRR